MTSDPAGIDCSGDCSGSYPGGTSVTLTATPAPGYLFAGWSGDCRGASTTCTLAMTAARQVTASFLPPERPAWGRALGL